MRAAPLVDVKSLSEVVKLLHWLNATQLAFMQKCWLHQINHWDQWSRDARWKYFALRATVVLGGVAIPVLIALQSQIQ